MNIRVAYDISKVGSHFQEKYGILRVIEEVMDEINKSNDVELTLIGMCSDDFLFNSISTGFYVKSRKDLQNLQKFNLSHCFKSKLQLEKLYLKYFDIELTTKLAELPKLAWSSIHIRLIREILYNIQKWDIGIIFDYNKFDIFHSTYYRFPAIDVTGDIPRVMTVYDLIPVITPEFVTPGLTTWFTEVLQSINLKRDWVVCISEYTKQEFCKYTGMSSERVFAAPLAAASHFHAVKDADKIYAACRRYKIPEGDYFLSLAAPQPRKNFAHLIRCFFRLLSEQPNLDVKLVLVGSKDLGFMYDEIFAVAESLTKFQSRVIFTGYIPDEELSEIYSGAKAFIFPSLYEGFGLPPLEAMQCGTPVIASNTTSIPEVVGDAGILVDPKDEDALCQAMIELLNNVALCQELSRKGIERAAQFSWARCASDTVEVYKTAISDR